MKVIYEGSSALGVDLEDGTFAPHGQPVETRNDIAEKLLKRPDFRKAGSAKSEKTKKEGKGGED